MIHVNISGLASVTSDYLSQKKLIEAKIPLALNVVMAEMTNKLQESLTKNWYERYDPKVYRRRTDDPSLGTALGDDSVISREVSGLSASFTYEPTGDHQVERWHKRDGDRLIDWIQKGDAEKRIPARPFWNDFLEDLRDGGMAEAFARGMGNAFPIILEGGESDVVFMSGDGELLD